MSSMRGLTMFISDIRNCQSKDLEEKRVLKEMSKIRELFSNTRKTLSAYDRKKYVWKLLYCFMLGYDVDFGHMEAINMICSPRYSEKFTGYMAASLLLHANSPYLEQVVNAIRNDIVSYDIAHQSLALSTVANLGGQLLTAELSQDVIRIIRGEGFGLDFEVNKKALTCLTRLYKQDKTIINPAEWGGKISDLMDTRSVGMLLATSSLLLEMMRQNGYENFISCFTKILQHLYRLVMLKEVSADYLYYQTPCPWLQIKLLKLLQMFPYPTEPRICSDINEVLEKITSQTEVTKNVNKNNTDHGILFEAINLMIHYKDNIPESLRTQCSALLGRFISVKEPNIRYIGLETMAKLAEHPDGQYMIERHQSTVMISLKDPDISIRKRALDVLFGMCKQSNANEIVGELLDSLPEAQFNIKEDLVLKTALLAERFGQNLKWYIDVIIRLITFAGDYVSNDIWHRVIQVVTGFGSSIDTELQEYAATQAYNALNNSHAHEKMVKMGSYLISEFSQYIVNKPDMNPQALFEILNRHFPVCSSETKCMVLTAYMKLSHNYPDLLMSAIPVFEHHTMHIDPDLQQRAIEYYNLCKDTYEAIRNEVLDVMPTFSEDIKNQNMLIRRMVHMDHHTEAAKTEKPVEIKPNMAPAAQIPQQPPKPAIVDLLEI
ncbi:unnamed protein product [Blepharisma stoltei]|uniref:Clathrin/coatomer adaptor adaptin-like N-terminal domain-containing protein n=1 Tax=Blepharisma stoltei TaxID=1481888 RepID=A0AAU9INK3_9CILI|nr:unnamed protein product [Blepharisma stoltei]